jgi:hypothetical protein
MSGKAPFDTLRYSGSVASNNDNRSQKPKVEVFKKVYLPARPLPEPVEGGSLINAPFDTPSGCSGSDAPNYTICFQNPKKPNTQKITLK